MAQTAQNGLWQGFLPSKQVVGKRHMKMIHKTPKMVEAIFGSQFSFLVINHWERPQLWNQVFWTSILAVHNLQIYPMAHDQGWWHTMQGSIHFEREYHNRCFPLSSSQPAKPLRKGWFLAPRCKDALLRIRHRQWHGWNDVASLVGAK